MNVTWLYHIRARIATGLDDIAASTRKGAREELDAKGHNNFYDTMTIIEVKYANIADLFAIGYKARKSGIKAAGKALQIERIYTGE